MSERRTASPPPPVSEALAAFHEFLGRYRSLGIALEPESVQRLELMFADLVARAVETEAAALAARPLPPLKVLSAISAEVRRPGTNVALFPVVARPIPGRRDYDPTPPSAA